MTVKLNTGNSSWDLYIHHFNLWEGYRRFFRVVARYLLPVLLFSTHAGAAQYTVSVIENPKPYTISGMNNHGALAGSAYIPDTVQVSAHIWRNPAQGENLGILGCPFSNSYDCGSSAAAINDQDTVVGKTHAKFRYAYAPIAFLWQNGIMHPLSTIGLEYSQAEDINGTNAVTGFGRATFNYSYVNHAYIRFASGVTVELSAPNPAWKSFGYAIDDANRVAGCVSSDSYNLLPGYWQDGGQLNYTFVTLPSPKPQACVYAANDQLAFVGTAQTVSGATHAALWDNGLFTDLGTIGSVLDYSEARDINNQKQAVGFFWSKETVCTKYCSLQNIRRGFIWENGVMSPLDDHLLPGVQAKIIDTYAINDAGHIAAYADINGIPQFVVLNPAP